MKASGGFGVPHFYVKKAGMRILYFFTMGLFDAGWLVDNILSAAGSFENSRGLPMKND